MHTFTVSVSTSRLKVPIHKRGIYESQYKMNRANTAVHDGPWSPAKNANAVTPSCMFWTEEISVVCSEAYCWI